MHMRTSTMPGRAQLCTMTRTTAIARRPGPSASRPLLPPVAVLHPAKRHRLPAARSAQRVSLLRGRRWPRVPPSLEWRSRQADERLRQQRRNSGAASSLPVQ